MQVLIAISGFCPRIGNVPCTTPFDFLFVISIHVPTWGTTLSISTNLFALIFQSTFPRGERHHQPGYHYLLHSFQSTFPRGERLLSSVVCISLTVISIHVPSWGTTLDGWKKSCADVKFQSTFPRGERHESSDTGPLPFKFQSTFPRGERHGRGSGCTLRSYFNPRSLVGNDQFQNEKKKQLSIFQSTFPRGERRFDVANIVWQSVFQSTFPRGERLQIFTNILCFFMQ